MESRAKRYTRYVKYFLQWVFLEKARGLDFTMRDKSLLDSTDGMLHGYSKTDEKHAEAIIKAIHVDENMKLLDVGCGKGAFLREASKERFSSIAGLEYVPELAATAKRNFRILNLSDRIRIYTGDATRFKRYGMYNVFYFFNPFEEEVMEKVIKRIKNTQSEDVLIILHNPVCADVVKKYGGKEIHRLYDKVKSYKTIIYKMEKE